MDNTFQEIELDSFPSSNNSHNADFLRESSSHIGPSPEERLKYLDKWITYARVNSAVSGSLVLSMFLPCVIVGFLMESALLVIVALEMMIEVVCSAAILWRYKKGIKQESNPREVQMLDNRIALFMASWFIVHGFMTVVLSIILLVVQHTPQRTEAAMIFLSYLVCVIFFVSASLHRKLATKLKSSPLKLEAISCWCVSLLAVSYGTALAIFKVTNNVIWFQPTAALLIGVGLISVGITECIQKRAWIKVEWLHFNWRTCCQTRAGDEPRG